VRRGQNEKAVALLKKVEQLQRRPRARVLKPAVAASPSGKRQPMQINERLGDWVSGVVRDTVRRRSAVASSSLAEPARHAIDPETLRDAGRGLVASPLFEGLSEDELLAQVAGLKLRMVEPGDLLLTEGEPGQSVYVVATGQAKVFVRNRIGQDRLLYRLGEGAFFGEVAAISGRVRTASVTAATPCALLELELPVLEGITKAHPHAREVLETVYIERATDPAADALRSLP
jgi:hypothetical protein